MITLEGVITLDDGTCSSIRVAVPDEDDAYRAFYTQWGANDQRLGRSQPFAEKVRDAVDDAAALNRGEEL